MSHKKKCCKKNHHALGSRKNPYDFVVVGAGTAGIPLARFLAEDMKTTVLVLEAGENRGDDPRVKNAVFFGDDGLANDPKYSFARAADVKDINLGLSGASNYPDGRGLGGGGMHNGESALRSTPDIYDVWGTVNPRWNYNSLLPVMLYMEHFTPNSATPPDPAQRGLTGPLFITQDDPPLPANPMYTAIATASQCLPFPSSGLDYNDPTYGDVGVSASQWYRTPGPLPGATSTRSYGQTAWLSPAVFDAATGLGLGGRKLTVLYKATAAKVMIEKGVAVGVRYFVQNNPDEVQEVFAKKKVILSAGTIATAQLMQLSGIGSASKLSALGIPVVFDNPNVGQNIQNHYGPNALIAIDGAPPPVFRIDHFYIDLSGNNIVQPNDRVRREQVYIFPGNSGIPHSIVTAMGIETMDAVSFVGFYLRPNRLGEVNVISSDPMTSPEIKFHYYQDPSLPSRKSDLERAVDTYRVYANISIQYTGALPLYPPPAHYPAAEYGLFGGTAPDTKLLEDDAKDVTLIAAYHACGSCRMGSSPVNSVVDGNLDVHGVKNLACCDDSVVPEITTGNTAYPAYLLGLVKAKIEGGLTPY